MSMGTRLESWFDDVFAALGDCDELYGIALDLRDLADKNPALNKRLRKFADQIDDISRNQSRGLEALELIQLVVEDQLSEGDDDEVNPKALEIAK